MQVEIKLDSTCAETKVIVVTGKMTEEVQQLVKRLSEETPSLLAGVREENICLLEQPQIIRIYAAAGKVFAVTEDSEYTLRLRLYELEERLAKNSFVRISNSEIINLKKVKGFDLRLVGTICVTLSNGTVTYVSRRYVAKIRKILGI